MTGRVTTSAYGQISEFVYLDGTQIGSIYGEPGRRYGAQPEGARHGSYQFPDRDTAIAACVSYATRGYWTGEV